MDANPDLPIPISLIAGRYLLFAIDAVTYLRREHHICGVTIGTLPQAPQQNVFLGLPLELMPEEVRLLVEKGLAYVIDDAMAHQQGLVNASAQKRVHYVKHLRDKGRQAAISQAGAKEHSKALALSKARSKALKAPTIRAASHDESEDTNIIDTAEQDSLFAPSSPSGPASSDPQPITNFGVTPASSASLLTPPPSPPASEAPLPTVPESYPLFKHLHSRGYFPLPGLRFGCQYTVYPGDPLRFHSHFLASYVGWDEELDLMDLVGGGRLGTGVKKGYLIGGVQKEKNQDDPDMGSERVRTFSIEWASM